MKIQINNKPKLTPFSELRVGQYHYDNFQQNLAKAVRKDHIQTDVHWSKDWIPNKLKD